MAVPQVGAFDLPPAYRKVAVAEFAAAASYAALSSWYRANMAACGLRVFGDAPLQRHGGPVYARLSLTSSDGLTLVNITFRPLTARLTVVRYVAEELDLPLRPPSSFLHGPFVRVAVSYHSFSSVPSLAHRFSFTITWPATISRLVRAVNGLNRVYVSDLGMGGGAIVSSAFTTLSFVRTDGGERRVRISTLRGTVVVGHSRALDAYGGNLFVVVGHIVAHRCSTASACA